MSGRPERLFPLFSALETLPGIGPKTAKALEKLGVQSPKDLALTLPAALIDRRPVDSVEDARLTEHATVEVEVIAHHAPRTKGRPWRIDVTDGASAFQLVFFHAHDKWLASKLPVGGKRIISGKVERFDGMVQMVHPDMIVLPEERASIPEFEAIYPLTEGVTQKVMGRAVQASLERATALEEWIDPALVAGRSWPSWQNALSVAHAPKALADIRPEARARERLAYDEFFAHQLTLALARRNRRRKPGRPSHATGRLQSQVLANLPYRPTTAQHRAIEEITADMATGHRMNRLLQGDVGSGKTLVALMSLLVAVEAGGQGVLMAPTEILARQHYQALKPLADTANVVLEILTGRDKGKDRRDKLEALKAGNIHILVGTHAVFQDEVAFHDLRLAIIDEQHRFGVAQRMALGAKGAGTDILVMTATPIPRSLSLTQYGDMDISVLDEKPPGRTPIKTALSAMDRLGDVVDHLKSAIAEGKQAYWVCPLVDESEVSDLTAAEERFKRLRSALGDGAVGLVHGQMPGTERDAAMARFSKGATAVLVATTVIEVGVDVPNASIMVIERAESFGLAQLHQLRGRVGRGETASTCLLLYQMPLSETARRRLEIMRETEDGFRIAEEDLAIRGAGDVLGTAQSGVPRFRIGDLEHQAALMAIARDDARKLILDDPDLAGQRGQAARLLLWLLEADRALQMISVG